MLNASLHSKVTRAKTTSKHLVSIKDTILSHSCTVLDYRMEVDAYSVGSTIRYMVTGVPPQHDDIDEYITSKNLPLKKIIQGTEEVKDC
jgi:hypothetical protein